MELDPSVPTTGGDSLLIYSDSKNSADMRHAVGEVVALPLGRRVYLLWGTNYFAIRLIVETARPLLASGVRYEIAGAVIAACGSHQRHDSRERIRLR
jgi:hypothetical protein